MRFAKGESLPQLSNAVQQRLPILRDFVSWAGSRLVRRMGARCSKPEPAKHLAFLVVVEPALQWLKAGDHGMPGLGGMPRSMLAWRCVAATDVTALRTTAQMEPPSSRG